MSEETPEWAKSLSDRERDLAMLLGKRMNDAAYTSSTFFQMKKEYERKRKLINAFTVLLAGLLTVGAIWERVPSVLNFGLAVTTGITSFFATYSDLDRRAVEAEKAGDAYNMILKEFQAYFYLVLKDGEVSLTEKEQQLKQLLKRYNDINDNTLATDDSVYAQISREDVLSNLETTDEELKSLLHKRNHINGGSDETK